MKSWTDFDKFDGIVGKHLPIMGDGDTMATQAVTATAKLIYKWYNDGDVYDNTHGLNGWLNDLSSYANWLHKHIDGAGEILEKVFSVSSGYEYEDLLYELAELVYNEDKLDKYNAMEKVGSVYECDGAFRFEVKESDW